MGEFNSDDHYIYYCRQESLRRNGVAIMVNKRVWNAVLGCNLKNNRVISVRLQGKPFNITVIQVYAPTSNTEEAEVEVEWFYEDLQNLLELTPKKDVLFTIGNWNAKLRSQETPGVHSDSHPLSQWCHPAISSSAVPFSSCPWSLPASESFPMSQLHMRRPKYWSFSFSIIPFKEIPRLISFRMD